MQSSRAIDEWSRVSRSRWPSSSMSNSSMQRPETLDCGLAANIGRADVKKRRTLTFLEIYIVILYIEYNLNRKIK